MWLTALLTLVYAVTLLGTSLAASIARIADVTTQHDLWGHGDAAGVVIWSAVFLVAALVRAVPMLARQVSAVLATLGVLTVLLRPLEGSDIDLAVGVLAGTALVLALLPVLVRRLVEPWKTAASFSAVVRHWPPSPWSCRRPSGDSRASGTPWSTSGRST